LFDLGRIKAFSSLESLERDGLIIDPAFTPQVMVLLGLVPVHFSVRTPKGQRVYKEVSVRASYWSLDIARGKRANGKTFTDFDFQLRGISVVRKAIEMMARVYLQSEEQNRRDKGLPVLEHQNPDFD
jgi:hypothetical protein